MTLTTTNNPTTKPVSELRTCGQPVSCMVKQGLRTSWLNPIFYADWTEPVFLHFTIDPDQLQKYIPYELDTYNGKAYITLVAFSMRRLRFIKGGWLSRWLTKPMGDHSFLNLRTYVKYGNEGGIHFINEWLNSKLAVLLGPMTFGLPYHFSRIDYQINPYSDHFAGSVSQDNQTIKFSASTDVNNWHQAKPGSLDEFLLERYTAFNAQGRWRGKFRIWHRPWDLKPLTTIEINHFELLKTVPGASNWLPYLEPAGGQVATGSFDVWIGRPETL